MGINVPRNMRGIFITDDDPSMTEKMVEPEQELLDLSCLNVIDLLAEMRRRKANFDTAPFDSEGRFIRWYPEGFTLWSGHPGTGKTTLLRQFACHLMRAGKPVFIASLEENPVDVFYRLACTALGDPDPGKDGLQWCIDAWHDRLRVWSYRRGVASHVRVLGVIRALAKKGVRHAFIDSLGRLDISSGDYEQQRLFGNELESTAATCRIHIHLVAHPKKPSKAGMEPDINDVAGSADIGRLADNVIFIRRADNDASHAASEFTGMKIYVRKQRYFDGACPVIDGFFNRRLKQFKPATHDVQPTRYLPGGAYGDLKFDDHDQFVQTIKTGT